MSRLRSSTSASVRARLSARSAAARRGSDQRAATPLRECERPRGEGDGRRPAWLDANAHAQRDDRIEHGAHCSRQRQRRRRARAARGSFARGRESARDRSRSSRRPRARVRRPRRARTMATFPRSSAAAGWRATSPRESIRSRRTASETPGARDRRPRDTTRPRHSSSARSRA